MPPLMQMKAYYAPTIVIDKSDKQISGMFSGTGARRIPSSIAQVMINHYCRHRNLGPSVAVFRISSQYQNNK